LGIQGIAVRLVPIYIRNQETKVLIDSGASRNFVSEAEAIYLKLQLVPIVLLETSRADGKTFQGRAGAIIYFILLETIIIGNYTETITFYILRTSAALVILGRS
jgi:hypothetical protein